MKSLRNYPLNEEERERLNKGIRASLAIPFIDSLEDYIWEGVFCYTKNIELTDALLEKRKKYLFDVVDKKYKIGWSAKGVQCNVKKGGEFELVIQRADILTKRQSLGFNHLTLESPTQDLGNALLKHWQAKIKEDSHIQKVEDMRICVLLKSADKKTYAYFEEELVVYQPDDLYWKWTDDTKKGLQGLRVEDDFCVYRWYPNQKQFFERFKLPDNAYIFNLSYQRIKLDHIIEMLISNL